MGVDRGREGEARENVAAAYLVKANAEVTRVYFV